MDFEGITLKPTEGRIFLRIVDDEEKESDGENVDQPMPMTRHPVLAVVVDTGADTGVRKGQTVLADQYVRHCMQIDDNTYVASKWEIVAIVSGDAT